MPEPLPIPVGCFDHCWRCDTSIRGRKFGIVMLVVDVDGVPQLADPPDAEITGTAAGAAFGLTLCTACCSRALEPMPGTRAAAARRGHRRTPPRGH